MKKLVIFIILVTTVFSFVMAQDTFPAIDEIDSMLNLLPARSTVLKQLEQIDKEVASAEKNLLTDNRRVYYSHVLGLIDELEDFKVYKYNILTEDESVRREIGSYDPKTDQKDMFLDDLLARLVAFKTAENLFNEKKVILSKIEYNRVLFKETILTEKSAIIRADADIDALELELKRIENEEALKRKKREIALLQDVIAVKQDRIAALEIHVKCKNLKRPLAKMAVKTFETKRKHVRDLIALAKQNLSVTFDELDVRRIDLREQKKRMIEAIEIVDSQIVDELKPLNILRDKRVALLNSKTKELDEKKKEEIGYQYELVGYEINYHKAAIDYAEIRKLYQQLLYQNGELQFTYLELYALESLGELTLRKINQKQIGVTRQHEQLDQMKKMAHMNEAALRASILTMQEMQHEISYRMDNTGGKAWNRYVADKIDSLEREIVLKEDYLDFLKKFQGVLSENEDAFTEIFNFLDTKIGIRQLLVVEKKKMGIWDLIIGLTMLIFMVIFFILKKTLINHLNSKWTKKITRLILIIFPAMTAGLFIARLFGYNALYKYVYFSTLFSIIAIYVSILLVGRLTGAQKRMENIKRDQLKEDNSQITVKISFVAILFATIARYLVYAVLVFGVFFIWTRQFNVIGKLIKIFDLDPVYVATLIMQKGFKLLLIAGIGFVVITITRFIGTRIFSLVEDDNHLETNEKEARATTLITVANNLIKLVVITFVLFSFLQELGMNIATLLTGAGIIGLAVGFGSQSLVKDFVSGFFILMEGQYSVGDVIKIGDTAGLVEKITLRTTILRNLEGMVHVIPNGQVAMVTNMTHEWARAVIEVGVNYKENVDHVIEELQKIGDEFYNDEKWQPLLRGEPSVPGVTGLRDSAVTIRLMVDTKPIKQWDVGRELNRRIKNRFDEVGIEIAYPHMNIVFEEKYKDYSKKSEQ